MRYPNVFPTLFLLMAATSHVVAQEYGGATPAIAVSAQGTVEIPADHVVLTLGVLVRDSTPTLAASSMDARLRRVTDALIEMGFPAESLPTAHYNVTPDRSRERERITSYTATTAVRLNIWDIGFAPSVIEGALAAGATDVTGLQFGASDEAEARDEALRKAVAAAKRDAEVVAEAAGGHLGALLEVSTQPSSLRHARAMEFSGVAGSAPQITPLNLSVVANVSVRWQFLEY